MDIIISVVLDKANEFEFLGKTYVVNDVFRKYCKRMFMLYILGIGCITTVGYNVAPLIGANSFFSLMLFVMVLLFVYNILIDKLLKFLLKKKVVR